MRIKPLPSLAAAVVVAGSAAAGAVLLLVLTQVTQLWQCYAVWTAIGLVMAGCLYEPCFALLTRTMGLRARRAITAVSLVAGLAGCGAAQAQVPPSAARPTTSVQVVARSSRRLYRRSYHE